MTGTPKSEVFTKAGGGWFLLTGVSTSLRRFFVKIRVSERYADITPTKQMTKTVFAE
jgi:hypothetical protein